MIKINLALKKHSALAGGTQGGGVFKFSGVGKLELPDLGQFRDFPLAKIFATVVVCLVVYFAINYYEGVQLNQLDDQIAELTQRETTLQAEVDKTKGYEAIKKQYDEDELTLKTKIEVIQKLIAGRQVPPKVLLALANAIPKDAWLDEFDSKDEGFTIKGLSIGFDRISDFMKTLGESSYFTELKLVDSKQQQESNGEQLAEFELSAKRR